MLEPGGGGAALGAGLGRPGAGANGRVGTVVKPDCDWGGRAAGGAGDDKVGRGACDAESRGFPAGGLAILSPLPLSEEFVLRPAAWLAVPGAGRVI